MKRQLVWLVLVGLLSACVPVSQMPELTRTSTQTGELTPYLTRTATATAALGQTASPSPLPAPSATPRLHMVKKGETVSGIAQLYGVTVDAILAANPKLNPNLMVVGSTLVIPASSGTKAPANDLATVTPLPVQLNGVHCAAVQDGGAWCFVLAHNPQKVGAESVSAVIRLAGENGGGILSQVAYAPLDLLPAGGALPLAVYFPPPVPDTLQASAGLLTALPVEPGDNRYLSASLTGVKTNLLPDGLSANVSGTITLDKGSVRAQQIWVLAIAYDLSGQVVGLRRWEMGSGQTVKPGKQMAFAVEVYSTGGKIEKVDTLVEARP